MGTNFHPENRVRSSEGFIADEVGTQISFTITARPDVSENIRYLLNAAITNGQYMTNMNYYKWNSPKYEAVSGLVSTFTPSPTITPTHRPTLTPTRRYMDSPWMSSNSTEYRHWIPRVKSSYRFNGKNLLFDLHVPWNAMRFEIIYKCSVRKLVKIAFCHLNFTITLYLNLLAISLSLTHTYTHTHTLSLARTLTLTLRFL